jgi:chromate reductase
MMGSFRRASYSRAVANYAASALPQDYRAVFLPLNELPLFNQDYDDDDKTPDAWLRFREQVAALDAVLFVTPEHNRSFPAVLKNALDVASRPAGKSVWGGKPAGVISVSPGRIGGALGNQHLRQPLSFLDLRLMPQPEMYVSDVAALLDESGSLIDERVRQHLQAYMAAFVQWVGQWA